MSRQLFKSAAVVSSMTMISRILGFIRDIMFARLFGADSGTDAFFVAFKIPNFLRRLFAEGAFAQAFIPVFSDYKEQGGKAALRYFIDRTAGTLALILMVTTIIGMCAAPYLIRVFAPGFSWEGEQYDLAVQMLRITFPYLFFISCVAFAGSILNSYGKFVVPAFTPVLLNISMISAAIWLAPLMSQPVVALSWGVFFAGIAQFIFQFPALRQLGLVPRLRFGFRDAGVRRILKLMVPALFGVSITQLNLLLDTLIASFLPTGSVSWLYFSDRLVEFPLGIFGIALATVILPSLSKNHAADEADSFSKSLDWGLKLVVLLGVPSSLGLMMLAEPMVSTLFQYDKFGIYEVMMTARSLMAYSLGLLGFFLVKILVPGFTARKDMKTPVRFGIYTMVANMILNIALVFPLAHAGLALATSLGAFFNASLLLTALLKSGVYRPSLGWRLYLLRITLAASAMSALIYHYVDTHLWFAWDVMERASHLAMWIAIAGALYGIVLLMSGLRLKHLSAT